MKKLFFTALIAVSITSSAFATDVNKVNHRISTAFKDQYRGASNVEWVLKSEFAKATFYQNNKRVDVFYNYGGERIGTSTNISLDELPVSAKRTFAKKYANYTVKEAIEFETNDDVAYFLTVENENESLILQVKGGLISLFKKLG